MSGGGLRTNAFDARPGGLAPADTQTRFGWSLAGSAS
jgi:hypothetical protein